MERKQQMSCFRNSSHFAIMIGFSIPRVESSLKIHVPEKVFNIHVKKIILGFHQWDVLSEVLAAYLLFSPEVLLPILMHINYIFHAKCLIDAL